MEDKENLFDSYYKLISESNNPGLTISKFYWDLFEIEPDKKHIIMFNKFIKLYGRINVFLSLSDMYHIDNVTHDNIYGLLKYILERRTLKDLKAMESAGEIDLTGYINEIKKEINENKELKFEYPFEEASIE